MTAKKSLPVKYHYLKPDVEQIFTGKDGVKDVFVLKEYPKPASLERLKELAIIDDVTGLAVKGMLCAISGYNPLDGDVIDLPGSYQSKIGAATRKATVNNLKDSYNLAAYYFNSTWSEVSAAPLLNIAHMSKAEPAFNHLQICLRGGERRPFQLDMINFGGYLLTEPFPNLPISFV